MSYVIQATLSNPRHPECGQVTIPFPIPVEQYDQTIEMLQTTGLGFSVNRDCKVDEIDSRYGVLDALRDTPVNLDELDYLAKRLDSFCAGEAGQFEAMAHKLKLADIKDFINLTYCCQQATVITDFSDLEQIGKDYAMTQNGGSMPMDQYQAVDGRKEALQLIQSGSGTVTPFGVVYDNGMVLGQEYNGRQFPAYLYDSSLMVLEVTPKRGLAEGDSPEYLYLPASERQIERTLLRVGITAPHNAQVRLDFDELPERVAKALDLDHLSGDDIPALNRMCQVIQPLNKTDMGKLNAVVLTAEPHDAGEVCKLAENLDQFDLPTTPAVAADRLSALREGVDGPVEIDGAGSPILNLCPYIQHTDLESEADIEKLNALAQRVHGMTEAEQHLFSGVLEVEEPPTFSEALDIAMDLDDYELVSDNEREYGREALRRLGADDELLDTIDGYMDFDQLGRAIMEEDGVRQTGCGLVRRLSKPFSPEPEMSPVMT